MQVITTQAPATEPISLTEAKAHLRVEHSDDDTLITRLIVTAREMLEEYTGRAFIAQIVSVWLDRDEISFPLEMPRPPFLGGGVLGNTFGITYFDSDDTEGGLGTPQAQEPTNIIKPQYFTVGYDPGALAIPANPINPPDETLADFDYRKYKALNIRYEAGYWNNDINDPVSTSAEVPFPLRHAILLAVADWYENRESVVLGTSAAKLPETAKTMAGPYRYDYL